MNDPKIKILWNSEITQLLGENKLEKVILKTEGKGEWEMPIDGVFVAIGHTPQTAQFKDSVTVDEMGYIVRTPQNGIETATNIEGVFTAGDVHDHHYRQAITAAGFGAMAALDTLKFLDLEIVS